MSTPRRPIDEKDVEFSEQAVAQIGQVERRTGGPRFSEDVVETVRHMVSAFDKLDETQKSMQETQKTMMLTMEKMMGAIDGTFGDRDASIMARVKLLEDEKEVAEKNAAQREEVRKASVIRRNTVAGASFTMLSWVFGRSTWLAAHDQATKAMWDGFLHSIGWH